MLNRKTNTIALALCAVLLQQPGFAQLHQYRPGFNLFSREQDVQLGKEAAGEVEKQSEIINDRDLNNWVNLVATKLVAQPQADKYPYTFKIVNDPSINAFALPGGPAFVHTGLLAAVDNESQLAGVLAHEITHVALRHGTNQASRANLIQLPALLAGSVLGSGSMLAQLGQLGIGLGANSALLKFSRTAETQADLVGVQIAAQAGYNPIEMARFFQKLETDGGARGPQFFSDHPNPGNRQKAIEDEIQYLPRKNYNADTGQLVRMKALIAKLPAPKKKPAQQAGGGQTEPSTSLSIPNSRPSNRMLQYQGRDFSLSYPDNWKIYTSQNSSEVRIAPPTAVQEPGAAVGYGLVINSFSPKELNLTLWQSTDDLVSMLKSADPSVRAGRDIPREMTVGGRSAIVTTLYSDSIFQGQREVDRLVTVARSGGVFFIVCAVPESEASYSNRVFDQILQSVRVAF